MNVKSSKPLREVVSVLLLETNHIKYYVKDRLLLDSKPLRIHEGDRIGLVGTNGSGKTTLLKILANKLKPDTGTITSYAYTDLLPQLKRTDSTKSGGEITQEYIQEILNDSPALLLADEPTNNLDTNHVQWVENKLKNWQGAYVIVSHDRSFLDNLCSRIWEIEDGIITEYMGNYSDYKQQKELEKEQKQLAYEKYEKKKRQLEEAIQLKEERAQRATKKPKNVSNSEYRQTKTHYANKQKNLQKTATAFKTRLEQMDTVEKQKEHNPIEMNVLHDENITGRVIIRIENVSGKIKDRILWKTTHFYVHGGDKIAVIGANGSGKTTLLKKIINQSDGVTLSPSVKLGYFAQNLNILDNKKSILENVKNTSKQDEALIRTVLARLHFFDDDVYKSIHVLSGGERVKVALAKLFVSEANTLILDEPTNYLDIEALEALEILLKDYDGTVIFVSHDRTFVENIADRIIEIKDHSLNIFDGDYKAYIEHQSQKEHGAKEDELLLIETKISEVLSRLSIESSETLEKEFQKLLKEKQRLEN